jgi:BirA family biotin operon repressor/biotin-[acetyl-CoA-carboxylase] ligase
MTIGTKIHRVSTCPSTNDLAKELAREGSAEGTVVVAEEQTGGRGTKGRSWHSPRGRGLYASVILKPRRPDLSLIPLMAGVACLEAIREAAALAAALDWPNDIVFKRRKVGGILCEGEFLGNTVSFAVLGIGLNIGQKIADFPAALRRTAGSLRLAAAREVDKAAVEKALWPALDRWYAAWTGDREEEIVRAYESGLVLQPGDVVKVRNDKGAWRGVYRGIDLRARLKMEVGGKPVLFSPAEILAIDYN